MEKTRKNSDQRSNFGKWGWMMVALCALGFFFGGGLGTDGANIYLGALTNYRGWDKATLLMMKTYAGWGAIIAVWVYSKLIRRFSIRSMYLVTTIIAGVAYIGYGNVNSFAAACIMQIVLTLTVAGFGSYFNNAFINNWFPRKKGLALGWSTMGLPLATMIIPAIMNALLGKVGVGGMFTAVGVALIVFGIVMFALGRDNPGDRNAPPDNDPMSLEEMARKREELANYKSVWTTPKLLSCKQSWLIGLGTGLLWMATIAIIMQLVPYLMTCGFAREKAIAMMSVVGFFGLFGSYIWGWLDQKIGTKPCCVAYGIWYIVALLFLIFAGGFTAGAYVAVFMVGVSVGGICNLIPSLTSSTFGSKEFISASAIINMINTIVTSCAAAVNAFSLSKTGGYTLCYWILVGACVVGIILINFIKPVDYKKLGLKAG